jgi:hypothetical protein
MSKEEVRPACQEVEMLKSILAGKREKNSKKNGKTEAGHGKEQKPGKPTKNQLAPATLALIAVVMFATSAQANICRVTSDGTDSGDGSDWGGQAMDLHSALGDAACSEIWVKAGVYKPHASDRSVSFTIARQVQVYGGFAGTESDREARDPVAHPGILSGDIDDNDIVNPMGVTETAAGLVGGNSVTVVRVDGTTENGSITASTVLDGFIITAGMADFFDDQDVFTSGGGMSLNAGSPTLVNLHFRGSLALATGGGLVTVNGSPRLSQVVFSGNQAGNGGGMYNFGGNPVLTNVSFSGNRAVGGEFSSSDGGGMVDMQGNAVLTNVSFSGNRALGSGGGMSIGVVFPATLTTQIRNAIFFNNGDASGVGTATGSIHRTGPNEVRIRHSLVQGCNIGGAWNTTCGINEGNNLADANPHFVSTPSPFDAPSSAGNLRLQVRSPAVDAGNDADLNDIGNATDLDGQPRLFGLSVDLGPYEATYLSVSLSTDGSGSGTAAVLSPLPARFDAGDSVTVEAQPDASSEFNGWTGNIASDINPLVFIIEEDIALTANFLFIDQIFRDRFMLQTPDQDPVNP